jgi:hypothetical protein
LLLQLSRQEELDRFAASHPRIEEYEREIETYDNAAREIDSMPQFRIVGMWLWCNDLGSHLAVSLVLGSLSLSTAPVHDALKKEISEWKQAYGARLNDTTKGTMKKLIDSMDEKMLALTRKVRLG